MRKIKDNLLQGIIFGVIISIGIGYFFFEYKPNFIDNVYLNERLERTKECFLEEYKNIDYCIEYLKNGKVVSNKGALDIFFSLVEYSPLGYLNMLAPFILGIVSIKKISKILNSRIAKYYLIRERYKRFVVEIYNSIMKYVFYLPFIYLILYLFCVIVSHGNIYGIEGFDPNILALGDNLIIVYLFNVFLMSIIYLLISVITVRIVNNYYIGIILNYLLYFVLDILMEIYLKGIVLYLSLGIDTKGYFLFFNVFNLRSIPNLYIYFGIRIVVAIILFIISILLYKNKESYVKYLEKGSSLNENRA